MSLRGFSERMFNYWSRSSWSSITVFTGPYFSIPRVTKPCLVLYVRYSVAGPVRVSMLIFIRGT
jgi:hypothetical protein